MRSRSLICLVLLVTLSGCVIVTFAISQLWTLYQAYMSLLHPLVVVRPLSF